MMVWKSTFLLGWSLFKGELLNFRGVHEIHVEIQTSPSKKYFENKSTIFVQSIFLLKIPFLVDTLDVMFTKLGTDFNSRFDFQGSSQPKRGI